MHAAIEFSKANTAIHTPSQWHTVIGNARRKYPYMVIPMQSTDFKNFKKVASVMLKNVKIDSEGQKVHWLDVKWF